MIQFSQYPEVDPFISKDLDLKEAGFPVSDFKEALFEEKRTHYIHRLQDAQRRLVSILERGVAGYAALPESSNDRFDYSNKFSLAVTWLDLLNNNPTWIYFYKEQPENLSTCSLGTDYVYDFYRNFIDYASRVKELARYEEYFINVFSAVYEIVNKLFNGMATRGQLFGYTDYQVIKMVDLLNNNADSLMAFGGDWRDILDGAVSLKDNFMIQYNNYIDRILISGEDMRKIIEPIVKYINIINISSGIITACWSGTQKNNKIEDIINKYNKQIVEYLEDYNLSYSGFTSQVVENLSRYIKEDRSNLEIMIIKMIKTTFIEQDIRQQLINIQTELIIPQ